MDRLEREKQFLRNRKQAYESTFAGGNAVDEVMRDLRAFCRADVSCFDPDPRVHAVFEGRREVWLRIRQHLDLSFDELFDELTGGNSNVV